MLLKRELDLNGTPICWIDVDMARALFHYVVEKRDYIIGELDTFKEEKAFKLDLKSLYNFTKSGKGYVYMSEDSMYARMLFNEIGVLPHTCEEPVIVDCEEPLI